MGETTKAPQPQLHSQHQPPTPSPPSPPSPPLPREPTADSTYFVKLVLLKYIENSACILLLLSVKCLQLAGDTLILNL